MEEAWLERWDKRYRATEYAFGTQPNRYLEEQLRKFKPGTILFAAEGEGRNAVFAATQGWNAFAFDISSEGKKKAEQLAQKNKVHVDYQVGELPRLKYEANQFDAIALIYAHFPPEIKSAYHQLLSSYLRKGGIVIFEAFSKKHINYRLKNENVGGPKDVESLFSEEELKSDFANYEFSELTEQEIELNEGLYHNGQGSVMRMVARKK